MMKRISLPLSPGFRIAANVAGLSGALAILLLAEPACAQTPSQVCAQLGTDDSLRPIPLSAVAAVNRLFDTRMSAQTAVATTVYRCADGHVLVCTMGANLPCGKANSSRTSVGGTEWCRQHPNAEFVPEFATGHDTIYGWRCEGSRATIVKQTLQLDSRGFIANYWKLLR